MPKIKTALSARAVRDAIRDGKPGFHAVSPCLYLKIAGKGRSWVFRYVGRDGKRHDHGLGACELIPLEEARDKVIDMRRALKQGHDPLARSATMTMQAATEAYADSFRVKWKPASEHQFIASMTAYVYPVIGKLPVGVVDKAAVLRVLSPIWQTKTVTADRVRSRIEAVLDWATTRGQRPEEVPNPARKALMGKALPAPADAVHRAAVPFSNIPKLMPLLRAQENRITARALEFVILTAARLDEVREAVWSEIDEAARIWRIPAARMKGGKEHTVPLSSRALKILDEMKADRAGDAIFPGDSAQGFLGYHAMLRVLRRIEPVATVHGFRSSFTNWGTNRTSFSQEEILWCLAHITGSRSDQAYRTDTALEKRRRIMAAWAAFLDKADAEVVPIRA